MSDPHVVRLKRRTFFGRIAYVYRAYRNVGFGRARAVYYAWAFARL